MKLYVPIWSDKAPTRPHINISILFFNTAFWCKLPYYNTKWHCCEFEILVEVMVKTENVDCLDHVNTRMDQRRAKVLTIKYKSLSLQVHHSRDVNSGL